MIIPTLLTTARPGIPGRTFFVASDLRLQGLHEKMADENAARRMAALMAKEMRTPEPGSFRRQYAIAAIRRPELERSGVSPGLRALHEDETLVPTHWRIIWFAETSLI